MPAVTHDEKKIATTSSKLTMETKEAGPLDPCKHKITKVVQNFPNVAKLKEAAEHTSVRTQFADGRVIRIGDAVGGAGGAEKSYEAHDPFTLKMDDTPYRQEARATQGAPNVWCEDEQPARDTDATTQNAVNTTGHVFDKEEADRLRKLEEDKLKRCTMEKDIIHCKHGRYIQPPNADGAVRILEVVVSGDKPEEVTFDADRRNAVEDSDTPECKFGEGENAKHTEWMIRRVVPVLAGLGFGNKEQKLNGDVQILGSDWLDGTTMVTNFEITRGQSYKPDKGMTQKELKDCRDQLRSEMKNPADYDKFGHQARHRLAEKQKNAARDAANKENKDRKDLHGQADAAKRAERSRTSYVAEGAVLAISLGRFLRVFFWRSYPIRIDVDAQACTGGLQSAILVFPADEVEWKLGQPEKELITSWTFTIKRIADFLSAIAERWGIGKLELKLLEDPELSLKCKWEELEEDAPKLNLLKHQCSLKLMGTIRIKTIVGLTVEVNFPVAKIIDMFTAGLGSAAEVALRRMGITATCGFGCRFSLGAGIRVTRDKMGNVVWGEFELPVEFRPYLFVRVIWRTNFFFEATLLARIRLTFVRPTFGGPDMLKFYLEKGDVRIGFTAHINVSVLWWERSWGGELWPESMRFPYDESPFSLGALMSRQGAN